MIIIIYYVPFANEYVAEKDNTLACAVGLVIRSILKLAFGGGISPRLLHDGILHDNAYIAWRTMPHVVTACRGLSSYSNVHSNMNN